MKSASSDKYYPISAVGHACGMNDEAVVEALMAETQALPLDALRGACVPKGLGRFARNGANLQGSLRCAMGPCRSVKGQDLKNA